MDEQQHNGSSAYVTQIRQFAKSCNVDDAKLSELTDEDSCNKCTWLPSCLTHNNINQDNFMFPICHPIAIENNVQFEKRSRIKVINHGESVRHFSGDLTLVLHQEHSILIINGKWHHGRLNDANAQIIKLHYKKFEKQTIIIGRFKNSIFINGRMYVYNSGISTIVAKLGCANNNDENINANGSAIKCVYHKQNRKVFKRGFTMSGLGRREIMNNEANCQIITQFGVKYQGWMQHIVFPSWLRHFLVSYVIHNDCKNDDAKIRELRNSIFNFLKQHNYKEFWTYLGQLFDMVSSITIKKGQIICDNSPLCSIDITVDKKECKKLFNQQRNMKVNAFGKIVIYNRQSKIGNYHGCIHPQFLPFLTNNEQYIGYFNVQNSYFENMKVNAEGIGTISLISGRNSGGENSNSNNNNSNKKNNSEQRCKFKDGKLVLSSLIEQEYNNKVNDDDSFFDAKNAKCIDSLQSSMNKFIQNILNTIHSKIGQDDVAITKWIDIDLFDFTCRIVTCTDYTNDHRIISKSSDDSDYSDYDNSGDSDDSDENDQSEDENENEDEDDNTEMGQEKSKLQRYCVAQRKYKFAKSLLNATVDACNKIAAAEYLIGDTLSLNRYESFIKEKRSKILLTNNKYFIQFIANKICPDIIVSPCGTRVKHMFSNGWNLWHFIAQTQNMYLLSLLKQDIKQVNKKIKQTKQANAINKQINTRTTTKLIKRKRIRKSKGYKKYIHREKVPKSPKRLQFGQCTDTGMIPIHIAIVNSNLFIVNEILNQWKDDTYISSSTKDLIKLIFDKQTKDGWCSLALAIMYNNWDIVNALHTKASKHLSASIFDKSWTYPCRGLQGFSIVEFAIENESWNVLNGITTKVGQVGILSLLEYKCLDGYTVRDKLKNIGSPHQNVALLRHV